MSTTCITIAGKIIIENPSEKLKASIKQTLRLKNPDYHKMIKRQPQMRFNPNFKEYIEYYEENGSTISIPVGCYSRLRGFLEQRNPALEIQDTRTSKPVKFTDKIQLRDYQQGVPELLQRASNGIARLDTGFGKTIIALRLASLLGQRTLIIVPKLDLLTQFEYEIKRYFGFKCGRIQGKHLDIKDITVATVQTLRNRINSNDVTPDSFGTVLVDEAHLFVPRKSRRVVEFFTAKYKYGFTATARRTDGQGEAIKFLFGKVVVDRTIPSAIPKVKVVQYRGHIPMLGEYHEMIKYQTEMSERNEFIAKLVEEQVAEGRRVLVLTKRVKHYESIMETYAGRRGDGGVLALDSKTKKMERDKNMLELRSGDRDFSVIFGTYSLLSTGIDIPSLDCLILAGDLKSDVLLEQSGGRIRRIFREKQDPLIIDIQDIGNPILKHQARARKGAYFLLGWETIKE